MKPFIAISLFLVSAVSFASTYKCTYKVEVRKTGDEIDLSNSETFNMNTEVDYKELFLKGKISNKLYFISLNHGPTSSDYHTVTLKLLKGNPYGSGGAVILSSTASIEEGKPFLITSQSGFEDLEVECTTVSSK